MEEKMDAKTRVRIKEVIGWREIDGKVVVFNPATQRMAILNKTGSFLWKNISRWMYFTELLELLSLKFGASPREAKKDVASFVKELLSLDVLEVIGADFRYRKLKQWKNKVENRDLLLELEKLAIKKTIPFCVTFELTQRCNEDCIHCYMPRTKANELTTQEVKELIADLAEEGCMFLSFTGGEIFTRPDLFDIICSASQFKFVIDLLTNGVLVNEDVADFLKNQIVRRVQVSLYGSNPETHDKITRREGSFKRTLRSIELLVERRIKVEVAFTIMTVNFDERHSVKTLVDSLGAYFLPSHIITPRNDGSQDVLGLRINDGQLKQLFLEEIFDYYPGRKPFQEHQFYMGFKNLQEANPCYSGINTCAVSPTGDILPCNQLLYRLGNVRQCSFREIWHNSLAVHKLRSIRVKNLSECSKCSILPYCSRCPGLALLERGDLLGPSFENCRITEIQQTIKGGRDEKISKEI